MPRRPSSRLDRAAASLRRYAGEYAVHAHEHAQVLVGLHGLLQLEADGRATYVDAASALVLPAGVGHGYLAPRDAAVLVIDAPMRRGLERLRRFVPPPAWRAAVAAGTTSFDADAALDALAEAPRLLQRRRLDLDALMVALQGRWHERWDTARLAAQVHLSPQRFHARFVELTGQPPAAWLRAQRLDQAERLLRGGMTLEAAALAVGYASASALGVALRRERGGSARWLRG